MYTSFREAFEGFAKSIFAAFRRSAAIFIPIWLWLLFVFWEPLVVLALRLTAFGVSDLSLILAAFAVLLSLLIWGISYWRFHFHIRLAFLYPVSIALVLVIAIYSMLEALYGHVIWKGRTVRIKTA